MHRSILAAIVGFALTGGAAHAGYQVITYSQSGVSESNTLLQVGYNAGAVSPFLGQGYQTYGGGGGTSGGGSPTDAVGAATASNVFTSDFEDFPAEPVIPLPDQTASASSSARASLAQGAVGVSAGGTYLDRNSPSSGQAGGTGNAFAQDSDTLHFTVAGATPSTVTNIPITFTVDGDFSVATAAGDSQGSILSILQINGSHFDETWSSSGASSYIPVLFSGPTVSGWVSSGFSSNTSSLIIFNGVFSITGPTADVNVAEALSGSAGLGTSIDYSNTASLAINSPTGVTFTSDSGVFLTQVPEPASVMLLAPIALLAVRRRKR
jgi:hypothetical protein